MVNLLVSIFAIAIPAMVIYYVVRGLLKYPEQRSKGGFPFNNSVPGTPPTFFDADSSKQPETPRLVVPAERDGSETRG